MNQKKPIPQESSHVTHSSTPAAGDVLLANIYQTQDMQITATVSQESQVYVRGDIDALKWQDLHIIFDAIKSAIVRTQAAPAEILGCYPYIVAAQPECLLGLELRANTSGGQALDIHEIHMIAEVVQLGLTSDLIHMESELLIRFGDGNLQTELSEVIKETLKNFGGKRMSRPVQVVTGEQKLKIDGRLSAKPDFSNFHPKLETLSGKFVGFNTLIKELFLLTPEKFHVLNYAPDQVDLTQITDAIKEGRDCLIRVYRTTDRRGNYDYAFAPDSPFKLA